MLKLEINKIKLEPKKYFHIGTDTFATDIFFFINYSLSEIKKEIKNKKKYKELYELLSEYNENTGDTCKGRMYPLKNGYAVELKLYKDSHRKNISLAIHEITHLVNWILEDRQIPLSKDTDEVYAYLTEELFFKFLSKLY